MSPIFNRHALDGLSTSELERLRSVIRQCLCVKNLSEEDRINLKTSLNNIEAVLRRRSFVPPLPRGPAPSP